MPVQRAGEDPAEEHADASTTCRDEAEDSHRFRAFTGFSEERHRQREPNGGRDGATETLHRARGNQERLTVREAAGQRSSGEERDPGDEEASRPE